MKKITLLLVILIPFLTFSQVETNTDSYLSQENIKGEVKTIKNKSTVLVNGVAEYQVDSLVFDKKGNIIEQYFIEEDDVSWCKHTLTYANDKLIKEITSCSFMNTSEQTLYSFDSLNNLKSVLEVFENGNSSLKEEYLYNDDNQLIKSFYAMGSGLALYMPDLTITKSYEYSAEGKLIKVIFFKNDSVPVKEMIVSYLNDSLLKYEKFDLQGIKTTEYSKCHSLSGKLLMSEYYRNTDFSGDLPPMLSERYFLVYNRYGDVVKKLAESDYWDHRVINYEYEYDKQGNWTSKTVYAPGQPEQTAKRTFTYFD